MSKESNANVLRLSIVISTVLFLTTLTFKSYFYFVPFQAGVNFMSILQALTILGWISLIVAPPLFFASEHRWTTKMYYLFMTSVLLWTVATLLIKISTLISYGQIWAGYLTTYPVMIFFEWIAPFIYAYIAYKEFRPETRSAPKSNGDKRERGYDDDRNRDYRRDERSSSTPRDERSSSTPRDERSSSTPRNERDVRNSDRNRN